MAWLAKSVCGNGGLEVVENDRMEGSNQKNELVRERGYGKKTGMEEEHGDGARKQAYIVTSTHCACQKNRPS